MSPELPNPAAIETSEHVHDVFHRPKRRMRPAAPTLVLNVTSMIDVIFLLMTYFMLTAQFKSREESFEVQAPERLESSSAAARPDPFDLPKTPVTITIASKGDGENDFAIVTDSPALGGGSTGSSAITTYDTLTDRATAARDKILPPDQRFILRPAADCRWEHALGVLNSLKRAGYNNIRFANPSR